MQPYQKIGMVYLELLQNNPLYNLFEYQAVNLIDYSVWIYLQLYFFPFYAISKQDEWSEWTKISLNGMKNSKYI